VAELAHTSSKMDVRKDTAAGPVATQDADQELWVIKVPSMLSEVVQKAPPGAALGMIERQSIHGLTRVALSLAPGIVEPEQVDVTPTLYRISDGLDLPARVLNVRGSVATFVGRAASNSEAKPDPRDPAYLTRKKREREEEMLQRRKGKVSKLALTAESASTGERFVGVRVADAVASAGGSVSNSKIPAWELPADKAVAEAVEQSKGALSLHSLFKHRAYYSREQLRTALLTHRLASDSADAEEQIRLKCDYLKSGPRRGQWALKPIYRTSDSKPRDEDRPLRELWPVSESKSGLGKGFTEREIRGAIIAIRGGRQLADVAVGALVDAGALIVSLPQKPASASSGAVAAASAQPAGLPTYHLAPSLSRPKSVPQLMRKLEDANAAPWTAERLIAALILDLTLEEAEEQLIAVTEGTIDNPNQVCKLDHAKLEAWMGDV
jgi:hypothetical protein